MNVPGKRLLRRVLAAKRPLRERLLEALAEDEARAFDSDWPAWVHEGQIEPRGRRLADLGDARRARLRQDAGRGGMGQRSLRATQPGAAIALVAANLDEARRVMVEGPAGLLAVARPGSEGCCCASRAGGGWSSPAAPRPSSIRAPMPIGCAGPEHHFAWCDELAKWRQAQEAWDNLMLGLRQGANPRALVTTTPRPIAALKAIIGDEGSDDRRRHRGQSASGRAG